MGSFYKWGGLQKFQNYIKPFDPETAPRYMKYIPIWA